MVASNRARKHFVWALSLAAAACASAPQEPAPSPAASVAIAPAPPAAPAYSVAEIMGAAPGELDALLGEPGLTRREGAGEYRRYALAECTLIVLLYPSDGGGPRVAHLDAAPTRAGGSRPDLEDCLAAG